MDAIDSIDAMPADNARDANDDVPVVVPVLAVPGRIHLVNRAGSVVYLGLRFADRCAFDYSIHGPGADGPPLTIEAPMCPCHPGCDDCGAACAQQNCTELCDVSSPRLEPGAEWVVTWDGRAFNYLTVCKGVRCAEPAMAPKGVYELTVPLFDRPVDPAAGATATRVVKTAFEIERGGSGDADIEISIGL